MTLFVNFVNLFYKSSQSVIDSHHLDGKRYWGLYPLRQNIQFWFIHVDKFVQSNLQKRNSMLCRTELYTSDIIYTLSKLVLFDIAP